MTSPSQNVATLDLGVGTLGLKVCWKKFKFQDLNPLPYLAHDFKKKGCKSNRISMSKRFYLYYTKNLLFLFFILHHHFYKTLISVYPLYTLFY